MQVRIKYTGKYTQPKRQSEQAAGLDLFNNEDDLIKIAPEQSVKIKTGVSIEIPEGFVGLLFPRSSLGFKRDATLSNSVGVIDSDYRGEIVAKVINHSSEVVSIEPAERFCQLVIVPYLKPDFCFVDELSDTERGDGGFGSTGIF